MNHLKRKKSTARIKWRLQKKIILKVNKTIKENLSKQSSDTKCGVPILEKKTQSRIKSRSVRMKLKSAKKNKVLENNNNGIKSPGE